MKKWPVPLCAPEIPPAAWRLVKECLDGGWISSVGHFVGRFEKLLAKKTAARHAVATVNGTAALHLALLAAGVGPGDEVLVSTLSFIAPANAVRYVGAHPVFVDAEPNHWQMDVARVADFLADRCRWKGGAWINRRTGRRVRALLPVHVLGHPCDMAPLLALARQYDLAVVEDATESLGALYRGKPVGAMGDVGCLSFNGNKIISTGGGGMVLTNRTRWAREARSLSTQAKLPGLEYIHSRVGYNYRLTNIQAALGCSQAVKLNDHVAAKRRIAERYRHGFAGLHGLRPPAEAPWAFSTFWLYTITIDGSARNSRRLIRGLLDRGVEARPLWQPLHLSPAHRGCQVLGGQIAERLWAQGVSLPSSVGLSPEQQARVIRCVKSLHT